MGRYRLQVVVEFDSPDDPAARKQGEWVQAASSISGFLNMHHITMPEWKLQRLEEGKKPFGIALFKESK